MGAAGMVPRVLRNGRQPGKQRFVCGAPPQTSLLTLIGEVETTGLTRLLRPLAPRRLDIRHRLPDRMVKDGGAVTAGAQPVNLGVSTPQAAA